MSATDREMLQENLPPKEVLASLGSVDLSWAQVDALSSAALFNALNIDPIEFAHVVGQLDARSKLTKLAKILLHRRDERHKAVKALAKRLDNIKAFRNAITHGYYLGHTSQGEYAYQLFATTLIEEQEPSAHELFLFTNLELQTHLQEVVSIAHALIAHLGGVEALHKLLSPPARVSSKTREDRSRDKSQK